MHVLIPLISAPQVSPVQGCTSLQPATVSPGFWAVCSNLGDSGKSQNLSDEASFARGKAWVLGHLYYFALLLDDLGEIKNMVLENVYIEKFITLLYSFALTKEMQFAENNPYQTCFQWLWCRPREHHSLTQYYTSFHGSTAADRRNPNI